MCVYSIYVTIYVFECALSLNPQCNPVDQLLQNEKEGKNFSFRNLKKIYEK